MVLRLRTCAPIPIPVCAVLALFFASCAPPREQPQAPPNIVLLFADDLGYGDLGSYGHPTILTPHLDRLAAEGIRLTSFYVGAPSCSPSRASLLTGRYPLRAGIPHVLGPDSERGMASSEWTLAEALQSRGYRTKAVGKWHLGHARPEFLPTSNGFDSYFGLLYSNDMIPPWVQTEKPLELYRDTDPVEHPVNQSTLTTRYTEEAVKFIESAGQERQPFFLYLAYSMVHVPIYTAEEFRGKSRAGLYGDVVQTIDWSVGKILETLKAEGLDENTLVVFSSDNGPWLNMPDRMFGEGIVKPWDAGSPGLLRGAKGTTYEGGLRVPGIVRWTDQIPAGQVSAEVVTSMDLFVTFVKAAGATPASDLVLDGRDVLSFLQGQETLEPKPFFYLRGVNLEGVRLGQWKLRFSNHARSGDGLESTPSPELYDLDLDPSERYNRAEDFPEKVSELAKLMLQLGEEIGARMSEELAEISEP